MSILIFTGPSCGSYNAWSKIGLLHQAVMFQCRYTGHAVLKSANPEIHKTKQCLCSPYCGGYLCHFAEYFCFPSASNCSRGHSIALCAAVGVIFGWVYVYFQYLYEKKTNPNMLMGYAGPCGSHVMLLTLKPSLRRHRKQISAAMWSGSIWAPREACSRGHPFLCCVLLVKTFIAQYLYICIYTHLYVCFLIFLQKKEHWILDARPWHEQAVLTSGHAVTTTFSISFVLFHPFACQWAL